MVLRFRTDGRYVSLSLILNGLQGEIPRELELLTALRIIELDFNALDGTLPNLANLVNLEGLFLFDNFLSGTIPSSIGALTSLTALDLDFNILNGDIPTCKFLPESLVFIISLSAISRSTATSRILSTRITDPSRVSVVV
jgi:Leucine-rich repeat (LRR) protein